MEKDYQMKGCPTLNFTCPYWFQGFCSLDNPEQECEDMMFEFKDEDEDENVFYGVWD